ncbi:MAG: hypothetical protein JXO72_11020 [Vicinamibacteria bacterium]|nr:hypothetical protein [Vicinamibacteria bacterium]
MNMLGQPRLGDVIDDYCPRCRLLLNHDIASLFADQVAKVTCRTCHNTHDYRHAQVPAKRRSRKNDKQSLVEQVLSGMPTPAVTHNGVAATPRKKRDLWAEVKRVQEQRGK